MTQYVLTERQRKLLESIVPGLKDGFVKTEWIYFTGDNRIIGIDGLDDNGELWRSVWYGVKTADFDDFVQGGFFRQKGDTTYTLNSQMIIDAVENDFAIPQMRSEPLKQLPSIFISYSREDVNFLDQVVEILGYAYKVSYDKKILKGGEDWWQAIENQITQSDIFIYLLSNDSVKSIYCRGELAEAIRLQKLIIPVKIKRGVQIPQYILQKRHFVDMSSGIKVEAVARLFTSVIHRSLYIPSKPSTPLWNAQVPLPKKSLQVRVLADKEPRESWRELNTGVLLFQGDELAITATGEISVDNGQTKADPDGVTAYQHQRVVHPRKDTYRTMGLSQGIVQAIDAQELGIICDRANPVDDQWIENGIGLVGSLIGWIGDDQTSIDDAFYVGEEFRKTIAGDEEGFLYLAINDTKGFYGDNLGEFKANIEVNNS